jgi:hypothetical protein
MARQSFSDYSARACNRRSSKRQTKREGSRSKIKHYVIITTSLLSSTIPSHRELLHWCNEPEPDYQQQLAQQVANAKTVAVLRKKVFFFLAK